MPENPGWTGTPMVYGEDYPRLTCCPDCCGRGWFLINPFATGGPGGCGGIGNMTPCQTCKSAKEYWDQHGTLPADVISRMAAKAVKDNPGKTSVAIAALVRKKFEIDFPLEAIQHAMGFAPLTNAPHPAQ